MKECKQCGGKVYSVGSSVHQTCRDEYIETLEAENKALRTVIENTLTNYNIDGYINCDTLTAALTKEEL